MHKRECHPRLRHNRPLVISLFLALAVAGLAAASTDPQEMAPPVDTETEKTHPDGITDFWMTAEWMGLIALIVIMALIWRRHVGIKTQALSRQNADLQAEIAKRETTEEQRMLNSALLTTVQESSIDGILAVDENKRILNELRRVNDIQSLILNNTAVGIAYIRNRVFEWINPTFAAMFGLPMEQIVGANTRILYRSDEEFERVGRFGYDALAQSKWYDFEIAMQRADGTAFTGRMLGKALDASNAHGGSIWFLENITERKKALQSLVESEERYRQLADNVNEMFWIFDLEHQRILYVNKAYETITGYSLADLSNEERLWPHWVHPDDLEASRSLRRPYANVEFRIVRADGEIRWLRARTYPIRNTEGAIYRMAGLAGDITEFKQAAERERQHQRQMIQADKLVSLGTLAAGMAHEINNPNMFIMLNLPLLRDFWNDLLGWVESREKDSSLIRIGETPLPEFKETADELFSGIRQGSERIKNIVTELKNYTREKPMDLNEEVQINAIAQAAVTLTRNRIRNATDRFSAVWGRDIPPVRGSAQRLEQVIINLLINACEALTDKSQAVSITTHYRTEKHVVTVEISDGGCGMTPDVLERIKDPFFTTKRDSGGTGLGVSIVSKIIDEHGGTMLYDSQPGHGTTVTVSLPLTPGENA